MKTIMVLIIFLLAIGCQKEDLVLLNPNSPGIASLNSEAGLKAFAMGITEKPFGWAQDGWLLISVGYHSAMGDEIIIPWGDWAYRYTQQYAKIILPDGQQFQNVYHPGVSQQEELQSLNTRALYSGAFQCEWYGAYFTIGQANKLIETLNDTLSLPVFRGNAQTKTTTLMAWALWWKGYAYSLIGSLYISGLIVDQLGSTNGNYKEHELIIDEATRNFTEAIKLLNDLKDDPDYNEIMTAIIPDFNDNHKIVSPSMWMRIINTHMARNILANKKTTDVSPADWSNVLTLAANGVKATDNIFTLGMTPNGINDLTALWHPYQNCPDAYTFWLASERHIQDYKTGDSRLEKNFHVLTDPYINVRNRGWNFGTRYGFVNIEDGGSFATMEGQGQWPISPTYEENQLMLAEARINTGDDEGGLTLVDEVRTFQASDLQAVAGTGLSHAEALEELRRERRIALFLRGLAFYDARRWGVIAPESQGGGRTGAMIVVPTNVYDPEGDGIPEAYPCFIEYNYMDYWDVPANELDFNTPLEGSAKWKN